MEAYFDNSATTRVFDSVRDIVVKTMTEDYGNPSAKHRKGMEAEQYVRQAAADIAKTLKVRDKEILFTSGGTESNNMALIGTAMANQRAGKHIISTKIEHASVYNPLAYLEQHPVDILITDIQMPVMNGYDATKKIRRMDDPQKADIPIIAMTANAFSEDKQAALDAGMNDHIAKPINMNVLVPTIQKYL